MTFHDHEPGHDHLDDTDARLEDALNDEVIRGYIEGNGPLTIAELPAELATSEQFAHFVNEYDWPRRQNAGGITPVRDYESPEFFWRCMYDDTLPRTLRLNNFRNRLAVRPIENTADATRIIDVYGFEPALHRAYMVARPLMEPLREIADSVNLDNQNFQAVAEQHPTAPVAAYAAYRLLGRLITQDDNAIGLQHMRGQADPNTPLVTDAHEYLWS